MPPAIFNFQPNNTCNENNFRFTNKMTSNNEKEDLSLTVIPKKLSSHKTQVCNGYGSVCIVATIQTLIWPRSIYPLAGYRFLQLFPLFRTVAMASSTIYSAPAQILPWTAYFLECVI